MLLFQSKCPYISSILVTLTDMADFEIGVVLTQLFVLFFLAKVSAIIVKRFGIQGLVGEILAGILVANLVVGDWSLMHFLGLENLAYEHVIMVLAELGVIFLLFTVGLETKFEDIISVGKPAVYVAVIGVILPFVLGFALIMALHDMYMEALFIGAAMVATSVGFTAKVIQEMRLFHAIESKIIIAAAVIDDILGMIILGVVVGIANADSTGGGIDIVSILEIAAVAVFFVLAVIFVGVVGIPKAHKRRTARLTCDTSLKRSDHFQISPFALALIVCLGLSALADIMGLAAIIGAFLAGMLFTQFADVCSDLEERFTSVNDFLLPFFFIHVGLMVNLDSFLDVELLLLGAAIILLAVVTKYVAGIIGVRLGSPKLGKESGAIVGIGMVPRGEVGITVAYIGLTAAVVAQEMYALVVFMSIVTALIAPPWMAKVFRQKYGD